MTKRIVILRPEPAATRTAEMVADHGLTAIKLPLFAIEPVDWPAPDPAAYDGLLLTSANGLRFAGPQIEHFKSLPVYAVGSASADCASKRGFLVAAVGASGVHEILQHVSPGTRLLHLAGRDRIDYRLPVNLWVDPAIVYRSVQLDGVDIGPIENNVTLVHSPRAGLRLAELAGRLKNNVAVVAISDQTAQACGEGWKLLVSADRPDERLMVALAAELCDKQREA
jgi:uroporphyrinogen-III synthase